jgi:tetratricopeptide (TPR) repeat protein
LLEWLVLSLRGDHIGARGAMQNVVALAPAADVAWLQLAIDNVETARPEEALRALDHIAPEAEFGEAWPSYWATRIEALHLLGDHARELKVTRDGLKRHPETGILLNYELRALAALGRVDEVLRAIDAGAARTPDPDATIRQAARELVAHGHSAQGAALLKRQKQQYETRSDSMRATRAQRAGLARTLYLLDERERARSMYDSLLTELPGCIGCRAALGVLAARSGNRVEALKHDKVLEQVSKPFLFGAVQLMRARIAVALGETSRATALVNEAFAAGAEYDVLTHADTDLAVVRPDSLYRSFARVR